MHTVKLSAKNMRGATELIHAGNPATWIVLEEKEYDYTLDKQGPWLSIIPDNNVQYQKRWVHLTDDKLFNVEVVR